MEEDTCEGMGSLYFERKVKNLKGQTWGVEQSGVWGYPSKEGIGGSVHCVVVGQRKWCWGLGEEDIVKIKSLLGELWEILNRQESLLHQKSRSKWIKDEDSNFCFFHQSVNWRRKQNSQSVNWRRKENSLMGLMEDGCWNEEPSEVKIGVKPFFQSKFQERGGDQNLEGWRSLRLVMKIYFRCKLQCSSLTILKQPKTK